MPICAIQAMTIMLMQSIHLTSLRLCVFEKTCVSDVPARYVARSNIEARDADFCLTGLESYPTKIPDVSNFLECRAEHMCALTRQQQFVISVLDGFLF